MSKLSASLEDYLELICNLEISEEKIRAVDISKKFDISRASVTEALKKLAENGYINYSRYETISLTETGNDIAQKVVSKHKILQEFFEKILGLSAEESSENACKIEHVITDNALKKISQFIDKRNDENI